MKENIHDDGNPRVRAISESFLGLYFSLLMLQALICFIQ